MIAESLTSLFPILVGSISRYISHTRQSRRSRLFAPSSPIAGSSPDSTLRGNYYDGPLAGGKEDDVDGEDAEHEPAHRLVPTTWVIWGLGASAVLGVVLVWMVFGQEGIHPWATVVGLVLASGLAIVGVRALGETDINPVRLPMTCGLVYLHLGAITEIIGIGHRQNISAPLRCPTAWKCGRQYHCWRCGRSRRPAVSAAQLGSCPAMTKCVKTDATEPAT